MSRKQQLRAVPLIVCMLFGWGCASRGGIGPEERESLRVEVELAQSEVRKEKCPVVILRLANVGRRDFGVSLTYGYFEKYIHLEIEEIGTGRRVPYPEELDLFGVPPHQCLGAGGKTSLRIKLGAWEYVYGGMVVGVGAKAFPLSPGSYRLRALYIPPVVVRRTGRCARFPYLVKSEWIHFEVPEDCGQN